MSLNELIPTEEAASILGIAPQNVRGLLHRGRLVGKKIGRNWVVERVSVLRYKAEKKERLTKKSQPEK